MNTNKSNNEAVTDTVSMSDSARSKDLAALERRSFNMSAQGEPIDETKVLNICCIITTFLTNYFDTFILKMRPRSANDIKREIRVRGQG